MEKATTDNAKKIWAALAKFQDQIGNIKKDGKNPHFNSNYATLEKVIDTISEPCKQSGIWYQQWANGLDIHTRVFLLDTPTDYIEQVLTMVLDTNPQKMGSAITYYRRYSLGLIFNLRFADDDGNAAAGLPPRPAPTNPTQNNNRPAAYAPQNKKLWDYGEVLDAIGNCKTTKAINQLQVQLRQGKLNMSDADADECRTAWERRKEYLQKCKR